MRLLAFLLANAANLDLTTPSPPEAALKKRQDNFPFY